METIKAPKELRAGTEIVVMRNQLEMVRLDYYDFGRLCHLDLSDTIYMDSYGFRLVFDFLPVFSKVTPPKDPHIVYMYNMWLDSKKGLSK